METMLCEICERGCTLAAGGVGACGRYGEQDGGIVERYPNRYLVACPISIETMPMLHFHPRAKFLQISSTGCNFDCPGCISTVIVREMSPTSAALQLLTPEEVVRKALENDCSGIAFLMNDPLAGLPGFIQVASLARSHGLLVGCSTNAYFTESSLAALMPHLDFINIGFKGFSDQAYLVCGAASVQPVLRNLTVLHDRGIHLEVSCIMHCENLDELRALARYLACLSPKIPLQVMRFIPLEGAELSREPSIRQAEEFCAELGGMLEHVYLFNSPGTEFLHTRCPGCGEILIRRDFYGPMGAKVIDSGAGLLSGNRCPACMRRLEIVGAPAAQAYQEGDFEGGYPFTRALEIIESMLIAMGVDRQETVVRAWEDFLGTRDLRGLHVAIQNPRTYIDMVRHFGNVVGAVEQGELLAGYLEDRLSRVESALAGVGHRPTVYYAMGTPLFYLRGGRLENQLTEAAGGTSLNRTLEASGRPGRTLSVERLNELDPEVMVISAFISSSVEDFHAECLRLGVTARAVKNRRIYTHPAPGWDFGSPRWILGLMFLAHTLHPELFPVDIMAEAEDFYRRFYGTGFSPAAVNRSFGKPSAEWRWGGARAQAPMGGSR